MNNNNIIYPYELREACRDDMLLLREFYAVAIRSAYLYIFGHDIVEKIVSSLDSDDFGGLLPGDGETILIIEKGVDIVGVIIFSSDECFGQFYGLHVHPEHQKKGIGTYLIDTVLSRIGPNRIVPVRIIIQCPWLVEFYSKFDFKVVSQIPLKMVGGFDTEAYLLLRSTLHDSER